MARRYSLFRPTPIELAQSAARLAGFTGEELKAQRGHAARQALPAKYRTRSKLTEPEWPAPDDLATWHAIGASDALAFTLPRVKVSDHPSALAYYAGYTPTLGAFMMPDQVPPPATLVQSAAAKHQLDRVAMGNFMLSGDITRIAQNDRAEFIAALCRHVGIDPIERPFMILSEGKGDSRKDTVYATRACAAALCRERGLSREIISVEDREIAGIPMFIARARCTVIATGRHDEATGVVPMQEEVVTKWGERNGKPFPAEKEITIPAPDRLANLMMKAETKAKRRAVLDCVGLGLPDETEVETFASRDARHYTIEQVEEPASDETQATPVEPDP